MYCAWVVLQHSHHWGQALLFSCKAIVLYLRICSLWKQSLSDKGEWFVIIADSLVAVALCSGSWLDQMPGGRAYQDLCSLDRTSINRLSRLAIRHKQGVSHCFARRPCFYCCHWEIVSFSWIVCQSLSLQRYTSSLMIMCIPFRSYCIAPFAVTIESAHSLTCFPSSCDSKQRVCIWNIYMYSLNPH